MSDFVTPDLRDRITLLVRLPMPPAVRERIRSDRATWAGLTTPTDEAEADTPQVVRDRSIVDEDANRAYRDGVNHECDCLSRHDIALAGPRGVLPDPGRARSSASPFFVVSST